MLGTYSHLFVQDENSAALLAEVGIKENVTISGDTRFDRVYKIPNATRGNKTQKNTPAAYYYDEHGYAAACAFVRATDPALYPR